MSIQPTPASAAPSEAVMQQAAEWFALLRSGEASEADRLQWQQWCSSAPAHQQAWGFVDAMSTNMQSLQQWSEPRALSERLVAANQRVLRRRTLLGTAAVLGTGALSAWLWKGASLSQTVLAWAADQRTATGEIRRIALPDQAELWLNTASAVNIDYSAAMRRLELVQGEVFIRTAPDAAQRPFVVDTRHGRLQALGTRFFVSLQEQVTQVAVYEGAVGVQVGLASAAPAAANFPHFNRVIQAGECASFDQHGMVQSGPADASEPSWPSGVLQVQDMRLQDLVARLEPYWHGHISVADEVAGLRVFGSFPLHDIPASLAVLENAVPVRIQQTLPWWIRVQGR